MQEKRVVTIVIVVIFSVLSGWANAGAHDSYDICVLMDRLHFDGSGGFYFGEDYQRPLRKVVLLGERTFWVGDRFDSRSLLKAIGKNYATDNVEKLMNILSRRNIQQRKFDDPVSLYEVQSLVVRIIADLLSSCGRGNELALDYIRAVLERSS